MNRLNRESPPSGTPEAVFNKYENRAVSRKPGALEGEIEIADDFDTLPLILRDPFDRLLIAQA